MAFITAGDKDGADKVADKLEELSVKENKDDTKTSGGQKVEEVKAEEVKAEEEKKWNLDGGFTQIFNLSFSPFFLQ